jgi:ElaB/YqjD/DUF883 family membrane-anchored ribosome-binding protein
MANLNPQTDNKGMNMPSATSDKAAGIGSSIEKFTHDVGSKIGGLAHDVSDKADDYVVTTRQYVKEHPIQSVAIAAATGVALGSLITLMTRKTH